MRFQTLVQGLTFALVPFLPGCATSGDRSAEVPVIGQNKGATEWQTSATRIKFEAGPHGSDESGRTRSGSFYRIHHGASLLKIESALGIGPDETSEPEKLIRILASDSGSTIVIEEEIPNDCSPCSNYILLTSGVGKIAFKYIRPPDPPAAGQKKDLHDAEPRIISLSDDQIRFRYSTGYEGEVKMKDLMVEDRPTFPG